MTDLRGDVSSKGLETDLKSYVKRDPGPYVGIVKSVDDPLRMGRLGVNIISKTKTLKPLFSQLTWCSYLSPFYGSKPSSGISSTNAYAPRFNGYSYGMWFVPPDIDTNVLVIYAEGNQKEENAFWIGCIQKPITNQMIPGLASNSKALTPPPPPATKTTTDLYGTTYVPAGEINRKVWDRSPVGDLANAYYPVNDKSAQSLKEQGLIKDQIRGTTSSSAQREAPSQVFGINTPGRIRPDSRTAPIELMPDNSFVQTPVDRDPGHTFVMDDGDENGLNQLTRLRTASGHQLLMHDTDGVVYIANASGDSWLEMSPEGKIYIYARDGFNLRSDGNFDLHSGADINFHAKRGIKFTSEDMMTFNSETYLMAMGKKGIFNSAQEGAVRTYGSQGISSYSGGQQMHGASGAFHLAGAGVHFNTAGASPGWGPTWLTPEAVGIVTDYSQNDVNITVGPGQILEANTKKTKTTVPNLVTHEPFARAPSAVVESVSQWEDPVKWKKLADTPGTLEYIAQKNRESDIEAIANMQYLVDVKKYIHDNTTGKSTVIKNVHIDNAKKLADEYTKKYNEVYQVKSVIENLSTDDLEQVLITKVTGGHITSVSNLKHQAVSMAQSYVMTAGKAKLANLGSKFLTRNSANNIPPSMRGTLTGQVMQVATSIGQAIGKFKFW